MKITEIQLRKIIKELILKEINLGTDAELFRKRTPSQPGYADGVTSSRMNNSSSSFKGEYLEDNNESPEPDSEEEINEFSGAVAAGGGPVPPIGYDVTGKPASAKDERKRNRFNIEKSFPYKK